jgi:4-hydroxybenzoate polyprenyltransferase
VGLAAGARTLSDLHGWAVLLFGLFFLFPGNILIYAVNDIFDYETDKKNARKIDYETLVPPAERAALWRLIALANVPFLLALPLLPWTALTALAAFLFFSIFYSASPVRAKAIPVVDSAFNVLYVFPGVLAYFLAGGRELSVQLFVAAWCWAMAMHAYSAVPDISADRASNLDTVATLFGFRRTIWLCALLYSLSAALSYHVLGVLSAALGLLYFALMMYSLSTRNETELLRVYKWFPTVNSVSGAALFFAIFLSKFDASKLL